MQNHAQGEFTAEVFGGSSAAASRLRMQVKRFAPHFRTVLLVGEPGAGKRTLAAQLHRLSPVAAEPLVVHEACRFGDCSAEPGGVLYLPGLEAVKLAAQEDLLASLRVIARETRLVVGCAGDPRGLVAAGRLRPEALERLGTLEIRLPALRDRADDLPAIAASMLQRLGSMRPVALEDMDALRQRTWAGNLAELWEACVAFAETGTFPLETGAESSPDGAPVRLEDVMHHHVRTVIERCAGNKLKAAELLGISRSTLYRMLEAAAGHVDG